MLVKSPQLFDVSSSTNLMNAQVNNSEDRSTYEMLLSAFSLSHPSSERLLVSTHTPQMPAPGVQSEWQVSGQ